MVAGASSCSPVGAGAGVAAGRAGRLEVVCLVDQERQLQNDGGIECEKVSQNKGRSTGQ